MATTIAKQLYVTVQYRGDTNNTDGLLGFASPYTKDAAFEKRKDTQDNWAYGRGATVNIDKETDDVTVTGKGGANYGNSKQWDASMLFIANCYPRVLNNDPIEGFEIAKSVRRYGWGGGGNVKWRITDPRGFDLEISSENFASVISCTTLINGVIQGKCVWGREGSNNILLPEVSDPYKLATEHTTKVNTKISLRDVAPGDEVELLSTKVLEEDKNCYFLGKYYFLEVAEDEAKEQDRYYSQSGIFRFNKKQVDRYLFQGKKSGTYFAVASPKVVGLTKSTSAPLDRMEVAKKVNAELSNKGKVDDTNNLILISPTKIDLSTVSTTLKPYTEQITNWPKTDRYTTDTIVCTFNGTSYVAASVHENNKYKSVLLEAKTDLANNTLSLVKFTVNSGYYSTRSTYRNKVLTDFDIATVSKYHIVVSVSAHLSATVHRGGIY